ncbi:MAG: cation transporter [Armatimonadetes bacterium]|nr:MAG: cation transporter [Armatimonadota bacterium]
MRAIRNGVITEVRGERLDGSRVYFCQVVQNPSDGAISQQKRFAAALSVASNLLLTACKVVAFVFSGSVSVLSEALHSVGDIVASVLAYASVRVSDLPADAEHPYGHGKVESFAALAEALLLVGAGGYVLYEAIGRFQDPKPIEVDLALWIIVATAVWNVGVSSYIGRVAEETDSEALRADAAHLRADVYTSVGVVVALILVKFSGWLLWDPIVAVLLSGWILLAGGRIAFRTFESLIDRRLPEEELKIIVQILKDHPHVRGYHQLRTRKAGSQRHIDAHILLDDDLSLTEAHDITEDVEDRIRAALPNVHVHLHTEPYQREREHRREEHGDDVHLTPSDDANL